ncbi:MAG: hypothetical protein ACYC42_07905 [Lysobacter sp.]
MTTGLLLLASVAQAQNGSQKPGATLPDILAQQREIRADLQTGADKYRYVDPMRRSRIYASQGKVFALLEGHQSFSELRPDDQLAVFNALRLIESHLVKPDEDDRMVCERVALAGTRRYTMACMTEAERRHKADKAKEMLLERAACTTSGCIGG